MKLKLLTAGNAKIKCLSFSLPVDKCCKKICSGCYSLKAEKLYPNVLKKRNFNYNASIDDKFIDIINNDLNIANNSKTKITNTKICRINTDGDFFSQEYIDKWTEIVSKNTDTSFYCYTKKLDKFDFSKLNKLKNINIIDSNTPLGKNYGKLDYCDKLVKEYEYKLCPCANDTKDKKIKCMIDCFHCLSASKVCFLQH